MPEPVTERLTLRVVATRKHKPSGPPPKDPSIEGDEADSVGRAPPPTKWLTKDGRSIGREETDPWPEGFTDQDGGTVRDLGESSIYYINYDNAHFRRFLDRERNDVDKKVVTEQYRMGMLVLMMGLEDAYSRMEQPEVKANSRNTLTTYVVSPPKALRPY